MQRPTLLEGIVVALLFSLLVGPLVALVQTLVGSLVAWKGAVVILAATYIGYLLRHSGRKRGRLTLGLVALAVLLGGLALNIRLSSMLLVSITLIWGVRSCVYSQSLLSAALQGGVCLLGCGAARLMYEHSGSLALALWSFFLIQAAFVLIPARLTRQRSPDGAEDMAAPQDNFGRAHQAAQQGLNRLQSS